jgi:DNA repair exonuclease SbcCD ATPase subunit
MENASSIFIIIFAVVLLIFIVYGLFSRWTIGKLRSKNSVLERANDRLAKYETIIDAEETATQIRQDADKYAEVTKNEAESAASKLLNDTKIFTSDENAKSSAALEKAIEESKQILENANKRAGEIAGAALDAKDKAEQYEKAAKAMRNIIKGYGDEYLVANITALDELAEDFSHRDAGQQLKESRSVTRELVKSSKAAKCNYKEEIRKTTAIQFVLDAFNGKTDTALSKVRHNNFGKLKQEIKDGFALVNNLGTAFRDARITQTYLEARLSELKWAVATNELKLQEREEQRRIREVMREEEKARREYEKAIKEAEKEEKLLQKALKQAQIELESAADEQRQELEAKLLELQDRLSDAEAKNQRAISMAQQTKRGHVYVISNVGSFGEDVFKIGLTRRLEPLDRVKELGDASVPFSFDVHAMIHSEDAPTLETELHKRFVAQQVNKVNKRKEFFNVGILDIKEIVDDMGIEAHWTLVAEAKEFHESLAIATQKTSNQAIEKESPQLHE